MSQTRENICLHEDLKMEEMVLAHVLTWVILLGRLMQDEMTTKDIISVACYQEWHTYQLGGGVKRSHDQS